MTLVDFPVDLSHTWMVKLFANALTHIKDIYYLGCYILIMAPVFWELTRRRYWDGLLGGPDEIKLRQRIRKLVGVRSISIKAKEIEIYGLDTITDEIKNTRVRE